MGLTCIHFLSYSSRCILYMLHSWANDSNSALRFSNRSGTRTAPTGLWGRNLVSIKLLVIVCQMLRR